MHIIALKIPEMVEKALEKPESCKILVCAFLGLTQTSLSQKKCSKVCLVWFSSPSESFLKFSY